MYCSQCASELTRDDVYCPNCAKPVASFAVDGTPIPQVVPLDAEQLTIVRPASPTRNSNRSFWLGTLAGALAMLVVVLAGFLFSAMMNGSQTVVQTNTDLPTAANSPAPPTPSPTPEPTPSPTPELPVVLPKDPGFFDSKRCRYSNKGQAILVRKDCDVRDCLNDPKTVVGVMPDGGVALISDGRKEVPAGRTYTWLPIETANEGVLWVASNKVICLQ